MAKKFITIGNVAKSKDGTSRYVKVNLNPRDGTSVTIKPGDFINITPFEDELARMEELVANERMKPETLEKQRERFEKDKTYGAFALAVLSQEQD